MDREEKDELSKLTAKAVAVKCVRHTFLEELHAGKIPASKTGDFTDVKVITPYGEIPWNDLSRINNEEIRKLMKEVVDKIYDFLIKSGEKKFFTDYGEAAFPYIKNWDDPQPVDLFESDPNLEKF